MKVPFRFMLVWGAVTATGMAISWAGVGDALRGTVLASPDLTAGLPVATGRPPGPPTSAADSAPPVRASAPTSSPSPSSSRRTPARATASASPSAGPPDGKRRTYDVRSGRVVLAVSPRSAELVSAAPDNGFQTKVWRKSTWIRVELTDGTHGSAVIASWNDHPTIVQIYEY